MGRTGLEPVLPRLFGEHAARVGSTSLDWDPAGAADRLRRLGAPDLDVPVAHAGVV